MKKTKSKGPFYSDLRPFLKEILEFMPVSRGNQVGRRKLRTTEKNRGLGSVADKCKKADKSQKDGSASKDTCHQV